MFYIIIIRMSGLFVGSSFVVTDLSRGFILYRRGLRYIGKSSCFFPAIKSTIGATVGCIAYHSFWWDVQHDIMRKG